MTRGALATVLGALALGLAACGDDGGTASPPGPDPATLAPPGVPLFAEATVRPEGDSRAALEAALARLLATDDPGGFIVEQLDESLAEDELAWESDIEPWLGQSAGIFFETFGDEPDGALILSSTDAAAAGDAIERAAAADKVPERERSYGGVSYLLDRDDDAAGTAGDFVVIGSERGFRHAVDALGGESLAEAPEFAARRDAAPDERLGFAYADPAALLSVLEESGEISAREREALTEQLAAVAGQPAALSLTADESSLAVEIDAAVGDSPSLAESELLEALPGDSWLAFAGTEAGRAYAEALGQAPPGTTGALSLSDLVGFDLAAEVGGWAGDVAGYMRGTSLFGLGGALVIETGDETASAQTLARLREALADRPELSIGDLQEGEGEGFTIAPAGVPIQFRVVQRDGKVVAGLGSESVDAVFSPGSTLAESEGFGAAADALGDEFSPAVYIDIDVLLALVEAFPEATSDPDFQEAKRYIDHLDFLAIGVRDEGERGSARVVLGLREPSNEPAPLPEGSQAGLPWRAG